MDQIKQNNMNNQNKQGASVKYTGIEKYIYSDTYNLFLKYKDMKGTDAEWESCIDDARGLVSKYKEHPMVRDMVQVVIRQLENKICGRKIGGYTYNEWSNIINI